MKENTECFYSYSFQEFSIPIRREQSECWNVSIDFSVSEERREERCSRLTSGNLIDAQRWSTEGDDWAE